MAQITPFLVFSCLFLASYCFVLKSNDINSKNVPIVDVVYAVDEELPVDVKNGEDTLAVISLDRSDDRVTKCAEVGEFCMNNKDCCSNSCLGFMKRCVSGSG